MTLLTICDALALDVGMARPTQIIASGDREWNEARQYSEEVIENLLRRVAWGELTESTTLTGDGTAKTFTMPAGFDRLASGASVLFGGVPLRPLSQGEWATLTAKEGDPRYFILRENEIEFWPYMATSETATVLYQSKNWCSSGAAEWASDDETALIDEELIVKGLTARWRRQKGMPFEDQEAEFEAALMQVADENDGRRV